MSKSYRDALLANFALSEKSAVEMQCLSPLQYPHMISGAIENYSGLLGDCVEVDDAVLASATNAFAGSTPRRWLLPLWPHLFWVVYADHEGRIWGADFQNQASLAFRNFDPYFVRPGVWTRHALESLADDAVVDDGWDEQVTMHFTFDKKDYEGRFVFGLLQEWRSLVQTQ